jgi:hypothetical protein
VKKVNKKTTEKKALTHHPDGEKEMIANLLIFLRPYLLYTENALEQIRHPDNLN